MSRPKIVLLGMLTKIPVGGVMWLVRQYAVGFERLGYDVYYVEAHGRVPSMFMEHEHDDATAKAVAFLADQMRRNGMVDRWAFHAVHDGGRCYGLSRAALDELYRDAALIINLHGGTVPLDEHAATGRLVYMGTDPVELELELHRGEQHAIEFLQPHVAFFTWGLNYGNPDCRLPWSEQFTFVPSPPPVVLDLWQDAASGTGPAVMTTVGNWRQEYRDVTFEGERYTWSKHHEFLKILDLPRRVDQRFELALSSYDEADRRLLEANGWVVRPGLDVSTDPDIYRSYITGSRGELTVAKDQNVRLRTGWFSERSATYLAAGRPVIQQDTGFGNAFPTGKGVFGFADLEGAMAAVEAVNADYGGNRRAATEVAREHFNYDVVLGDILDHMGMNVPLAARRPPASVEAELAELRTAVQSMSESLRLREAELAAVLREIGSGPSEGSKDMRYMRMLSDVRDVVEATVPAGAGIAVVAKGGDDLLRFPGRDVQCVPQDGGGQPLSYHPTCTRAAIAQAEVARWRGADYFVLPQWSSWWLDAYPGLGPDLDGRYRKVYDCDGTAVWSLGEPAAERSLADAIDECEHVLGRPPVILDWDAGIELGARSSHCSLCSSTGDALPFLDDTIDVVAVGVVDEARAREARRVATMAVAVCRAGAERDVVAVRWVGDRPLGLDQMVSVVVRERRGYPVTTRWLSMLAESLPSYVPSEILLVRDGAGGRRALPLSTMSLTTCVSLVDAARAAKGETVVVLDSSTVVLPGWLPPLLRTFRTTPGAAAVCGMVLQADGALLQPVTAGSSAYEIEASRHSYVRAVDDCLGTFVALPGDLFPAVAGRACAEPVGTAVSAAARDENRSIVYQPEAVAVQLDHTEEVRHG